MHFLINLWLHKPLSDNNCRLQAMAADSYAQFSTLYLRRTIVIMSKFRQPSRRRRRQRHAYLRRSDGYIHSGELICVFVFLILILCSAILLCFSLHCICSTKCPHEIAVKSLRRTADNNLTNKQALRRSIK